MNRKTASGVIGFLILICGGTAQGDFDFREVARTGDMIPNPSSPIASFGHWVSINDAGQVGFKLVRQDGSEAIVRATPNPEGVYDQFDIIESGDGDFRRFSDQVGINANGDVSYRLRTATSPVNFSIRRNTTSVAGTGSSWHFSNVMSKTDIGTERDGMVCFRGAVLDDSYRIRDQIRKGDGRDGNRVSSTILIAAEPEFTSLDAYCSINESGTAVFTGSHPSLGTGIFVGNGGPWQTVATTTIGFTTTGSQPSIANDGRVALYGISSGEEGIYIWEAGSPPQLRIPIGDLVTSFAPGGRATLNEPGQVAFAGTTDVDGADVSALFRSCGVSAEIVTKIGDEINGSQPINQIELWDGLNSNGDVVFWSRQTDNSESIQMAHSASVCQDVASNVASRANPWILEDVVPRTQVDSRWREDCLGEPRCCFSIPDSTPNTCEQNWVCDDVDLCEPPDCGSGSAQCAQCNQCTIGSHGCTLTCASMVYNFWLYPGVQDPAFNVAALNQPMVFNNLIVDPDNGRQITNDIDWHMLAVLMTAADDLGRTFRARPYRKYPKASMSLCEIEWTLRCTQAPLVLRVRDNRHSVICYGIDYTASDPYERILIYNPNNYDKTTLKEWKGELKHSFGWVISPGNPGGCSIRGNSPVELLATDNLGRRSGYDPTTGEFLDEIPGVVYFADSENDLDSPVDPPPPRNEMHKILEIPPEIRGVVNISVYPLETATVGIQVTGRRADGSVAFASAELIDMQVGEPFDQDILMPVSADYDFDDDVDFADFAHLQNCFGGPEAPPAQGCEDADLDANGHVDLPDLKAFVEINFTGPL